MSKFDEYKRRYNEVISGRAYVPRPQFWIAVTWLEDEMLESGRISHSESVRNNQS